MPTHEQTINTSLGEVLEDLGRGWNVRSEKTGKIFKEGGRPDILIEKLNRWPIVIEAEVGNYTPAEIEAQARLGNHLASTGAQVHAAVALVYPQHLRDVDGAALRDALRECTFEFALFASNADTSISRFPETGWISGNISELVILIHRSSIPAWRAEQLAETLEQGVIQADGAFSEAHPHGSQLGERVAEILGQADDETGQTRRMAMTVIIDALVFHAALAEVGMQVLTTPPRSIKSLGELRSQGSFQPTQVSDEWHLILEVNYWPIFYTAGEIVRILPTKLASSILDILWITAEELIVGGVTKSHDLTGIVFQKLIADRKFLATYYTRPSGAALLAGLALPVQRPIVGNDWANAEALSTTQIGDFACGTGTLLSTAYQRIGLLHEIHGGDPRILHPTMMERGLVGLDVLTVAVHLTAAMLAGSHPDTPFEGECLLTMPYGLYEWGVCIGSLDLLPDQTTFEIIEAAAETAGGRGAEEVMNLVHRIGHKQFSLVIMNPPFVRHGAREGDRTEVHNPAFAAFGATEEEQNQLSKHLKQLSVGGYGHGHAGLASYFVDLAHRKTALFGTLALVLPLTSLSGNSWKKVRALLRTEYASSIVVTISQGGSHSRSFSADTGVAECLFIGRKHHISLQTERRGTFVVLSERPNDTFEGEQIAHAISKMLYTAEIRCLEDGPFGGTRLLLGNSFFGEVLDCPLPLDGAWQLVGIRDITLGQTAYQLTKGRLWVEGMPADPMINIPVSSIEDVILGVGPHHLDIAGAEIKSDGLPQGPFEHIPGNPPGAGYPCLWNHENVRERKLFVEPDSHCRIRDVDGDIPNELVKKAEARWATAARAHYNLDLRFNSQSLIVAMTQQPCIGGRAWPTVIFNNPVYEYAFALWSNSTLGLLCHWWMSNKSQDGRGVSTITSIPTFATLDLRKLTSTQLEVAEDAFNMMTNHRFLPFDQINEDPSRAELDRRLIVDVLGLPPELCSDGGPVDRLRAKLSAEPQIHSDKKSRVVFTENGEETVPRL